MFAGNEPAGLVKYSHAKENNASTKAWNWMNYKHFFEALKYF
jgi:hypothetical protein